MTTGSPLRPGANVWSQLYFHINIGHLKEQLQDN